MPSSPSFCLQVQTICLHVQKICWQVQTICLQVQTRAPAKDYNLFQGVCEGQGGAGDIIGVSTKGSRCECHYCRCDFPLSQICFSVSTNPTQPNPTQPNPGVFMAMSIANLGIKVEQVAQVSSFISAVMTTVILSKNYHLGQAG